MKVLVRRKKLQRDIQITNKSYKVPLVELLTDEFLTKNSTFKSFWVFQSSQIFKTYGSIENIPKNELDKFICANSKFNSWEDFLSTATEEYITKKVVFLI